MDRTIVYPGSIPLDTDLLQCNRNTMVALGALMKAVLGTETVVDGLAVSPTAPNSLSVSVGPGSITAFAVVDTMPFGSLATDGDGLLKMGVNLEFTTLTVSPPTIAGQSVAWLIEAAFVETDTNSVVLPYYNASNPTQPWLGPANAGTAQPTSRVQQVQLQARPGVPAATGSQVPPGVDAGWVPEHSGSWCYRAVCECTGVAIPVAPTPTWIRLAADVHNEWRVHCAERCDPGQSDGYWRRRGGRNSRHFARRRGGGLAVGRLES